MSKVREPEALVRRGACCRHPNARDDVRVAVAGRGKRICWDAPALALSQAASDPVRTRVLSTAPTLRAGGGEWAVVPGGGWLHGTEDTRGVCRGGRAR